MESVAHGLAARSEFPAGEMERAGKTRSGCYARGGVTRPDRYQMVVMNPNQIIFLDDLFKLGREMIIDLEISGEIPACELGEVQPIMQNWPQHSIGKAAVIFLKAYL